MRKIGIRYPIFAFINLVYIYISYKLITHSEYDLMSTATEIIFMSFFYFLIFFTAGIALHIPLAYKLGDFLDKKINTFQEWLRRNW